MNKVPLYHADLFVKFNVGTEEQRQDLKKQVLSAKDKDIETENNSNPGCWRSEAKYEMDWLFNALNDLIVSANNTYFPVDKVFADNVSSCKTLELNYWTNVNEPGSTNALHTHHDDAWAGIYYIQAEGTGELMFSNPANTLLQCNMKSPFTKMQGVQPKDGMLVLWPGWVPHEVWENKSNKQRINIAWGINFG